MLYIILAVAAVGTFIWLLQFKDKLRAKPWVLLVLSVLHVICGTLSVKLFAFLEQVGKSNPGAMSLYGAVFFLPVLYYAGAKLFKKKPSDIFDIFTVPIAGTLMLSRINCLYSGCCVGRLIRGTSLHYPTRELEILFYLVFLAFIAPKILKDKTKGTAYPLYMTAYGAFRLITEFFRDTATPGVFHLAHLWSMIAIVIGLSAYLELKSRQRDTAGNKRRRRS